MAVRGARTQCTELDVFCDAIRNLNKVLIIKNYFVIQLQYINHEENVFFIVIE